MAVADREIEKAYMGCCIGDGNNRFDPSTVNDCRSGTRTAEIQAFADHQTLFISRGSNEDRIAGRSYRDGMSDGFARG